jgi:hypothetical protein
MGAWTHARGTAGFVCGAPPKPLGTRVGDALVLHRDCGTVRKCREKGRAVVVRLVASGFFDSAQNDKHFLRAKRKPQLQDGGAVVRLGLVVGIRVI